jgi:hypothetical protein
VEESEESDVDASSMSEDVDEGYLSEGEVSFPRNGPRKTSQIKTDLKSLSSRMGTNNTL